MKNEKFQYNKNEMRILVVEDEKRLAEVIKKGLVEEGYSVDVAYDGAEGQYMAESASYDLVILDIMLPKRWSYYLPELRIRGINTPILMLTAKDSAEDRVKVWTQELMIIW